MATRHCIRTSWKSTNNKNDSSEQKTIPLTSNSMNFFFACECYYYGEMQLFSLQVLDFIDVEQNCNVYLFRSMIDDMHEFEWFSRCTTQSFYFRMRNMFMSVMYEIKSKIRRITKWMCIQYAFYLLYPLSSTFHSQGQLKIQKTIVCALLNIRRIHSIIQFAEEFPY